MSGRRHPFFESTLHVALPLVTAEFEYEPHNRARRFVNLFDSQLMRVREAFAAEAYRFEAVFANIPHVISIRLGRLG